jgi:DNA-binding IclR family transcriptional regulator
MTAKPEKIVQKSDRYRVPMLMHALSVLETLALGAPGPSGQVGWSLQELVERTKLSKSSVYRILYTFSTQGWVERDPVSGRYTLGERLQILAHRAPKPASLESRVIREMAKLRDAFGETVNLATLDAHGIRYVKILEGTHALRMSATVGTEAPLHAAAVAKAILERLPPAHRSTLLTGYKLQRFTPSTHSSRKALENDLLEIGTRGVAYDDQETEPGAFCVAISIGQPGQCYGLSLSGPEHRMRANLPAIETALKAIQKKLQGL